MTKEEIATILAQCVPEAIAYAAGARNQHSCGVRGKCHAVFMVHPSATLHKPILALVDNEQGDGLFVAVLPTEGISTILELHGLPTAGMWNAVDNMSDEATMIIGVVDEAVAWRQVLITDTVLSSQAIGEA